MRGRLEAALVCLHGAALSVPRRTRDRITEVDHAPSGTAITQAAPVVFVRYESFQSKQKRILGAEVFKRLRATSRSRNTKTNQTQLRTDDAPIPHDSFSA